MFLPFTRLAAVGFLSYGIGYCVPLLQRDLGITDATAGLHASAMALGTLLAGLTGARLFRRWGVTRLAQLAALLVAVASALIAIGPNVLLTLAGASLLGACGGIVLSWVNLELSAAGGQRGSVALARANLVALVAATVAPLSIGAVTAIGADGRLAMLLPVGLIGIVESTRGRTSPPEPAGHGPSDDAPGDDRALTSTYWRAWIGLVLFISLEFTIVFWGASILERATGADTPGATTAAGGFVLGMVASRGILSTGLGTRTSRIRVQVAALVAVIVGVLVTWQAPNLVVGGLGLFVAGMGVGPLYPLGISFSLSLVPAARALGAARATLATGVALLGAPFLLGVAGEQIGLVNAWPLVAVIAAAAIGLVVLTRADEGEAPAAAAEPPYPSTISLG